MAGTIRAGELPIIMVDNLPTTDNSVKILNVRDTNSRTSAVATIDSPRFTGIVTAPTPPKTDNSKRIATTKFVQDAISEVVSAPSIPTVRDFPPSVEAGLTYTFRVCCSVDMFGFPVDYYQIQHATPLIFSKDTNIRENEAVTMTIPANSDNVQYQISVIGVKGTKTSVPLVVNVNVISIPTVIGQEFGGGYYMGRFAMNGKRYALIVSPRDEGTFVFRDAYGNGTHLNGYLGNLLTGQMSVIDGKTNTDIMKSILPDQPLLNWLDATNLTGIGDKHDWYIPAMNELEMIYRSAKPTSEQNVITSSTGIVNNNNLFRDFDFPRGQNLNSIPNTSPYTLINPEQSRLVDFTGDSGEALYGLFYNSTAQTTSQTNGIMDNLWFGVQFFGTLNTTTVNSFVGPVHTSNQLYSEHWIAERFTGFSANQEYLAKVRLVRRILIDE